MPALVALIRPVSSTIADCELTHLERLPIDVQRARAQHAAYAYVLRDRDCRVVTLPGADDLPDSVFVEDTAIVLDEIAIITRPGAPARRAEVATVAAELARHRPVTRMQPPATLDGGDVLRLGHTLFVGASSRTGSDGIAALRTAAEPFGYRVVPVALTGCLHLKTAATAVAADRLLVNPQWVDTSVFGSVQRIEVAAHEPFGANALLVGDHVICAAAFPATCERLVNAGLAVHTVDVSELAKAEGGVTCCSIIFEDRPEA